LFTLAQHRHLCPEMEPHFGFCFAGKLSELLEKANVPLYFLGNAKFSRPWTVLQVRRQLRRLLEEEKFDAVVCHSCWLIAIFGATVRRQQLPLVFYAHDVISGKHWLERLAQTISPDLAITNSQFTLSFLRRFYPQAQAQYYYYPVAPAVVNNREQTRRILRSQIGTPADQVVIIQVSRLEKYKGHDQLLSALTLLKDVPGWECWMVGGAQRPQEHRYLEALQTQVQAGGISDLVKFLGQRADVPELLAAADIHCQPNRDPEPFGITFIEALYAGLPVVTTAIGGGQEIVTSDCGRLVPVNDQFALASSLKDLIQSPQLRTSLGKVGQQRALELCDPESQINQFYQLISH
jgi:glycosyltransferase involved in cell wall biosynthesis